MGGDGEHAEDLLKVRDADGRVVEVLALKRLQRAGDRLRRGVGIVRHGDVAS
jgi:hypothetical protein